MTTMCRVTLSAAIWALFGTLPSAIAALPAHGHRATPTTSIALGPLAVCHTWPYTQVADGAFAAFTGRNRVVVESRLMGPEYMVVGGNSPLAGLPGPIAFKHPGGGLSHFGPSAAISGDGSLMAAEVHRAGAWWRVWVWHVAGAGRRAPIAMDGLPAYPQLHAMSFSPKGRLIAFMGTSHQSKRERLILCRTSNGKLEQTLRFPKYVKHPKDYIVAMISFVSRHQIDCVIGRSGRVHLLGWNLPSGKLCLAGVGIKSPGGVWCGASDRESNEFLLSGTALHAKAPGLLILDSGNGATVSRIKMGRLGGGKMGKRFESGVTATGIAVAPDGRFAVVVGFGRLAKRRRGSRLGGWLKVIDVKAGKVIYSANSLPAEVPWHVAVSPGGRRLVVASNTRFYILRAPFRL